MIDRQPPLHSARAVSMELYNRLLNIKVANGFNTDIGLRVFRGRTSIDSNTIPCVVIHELDDTQIDEVGKKGLIRMRQSYTIVGYSSCDPDHPNDMVHSIIEDIKRVIFDKDNRTFQGKVQDIVYRGREIGVRADGDSSIFAGAKVDINYSEDLSNPSGQQV